MPHCLCLALSPYSNQYFLCVLLFSLLTVVILIFLSCSVSERSANGAEPGMFGWGGSHSRFPAAALKLLQGVAVSPAQTAPRCSGKSRGKLHMSRDNTNNSTGAATHSVFLPPSLLCRWTCVICARLARICCTARRCFITTSRSGVFIMTKKTWLTHKKKTINNEFMFVLEYFRLKTVRRCPPLPFLGHSGPPKPCLKRQKVEGRERKLSRRPCWLCSAVFWRSSAKPWQLCSTSPQTAARYFLTRSPCLFWHKYNY